MTDKTKRRMQQSVSRGVTFLNKIEPNWKRKLKRKITRKRPLDMSFCEHCVLGKLKGSYPPTMTSLFPLRNDEQIDQIARKLGFLPPPWDIKDPMHDGQQNYRYLTELWLAKLED